MQRRLVRIRFEPMEIPYGAVTALLDNGSVVVYAASSVPSDKRKAAVRSTLASLDERGRNWLVMPGQIAAVALPVGLLPLGAAVAAAALATGVVLSVVPGVQSRLVVPSPTKTVRVTVAPTTPPGSPPAGSPRPRPSGSRSGRSPFPGASSQSGAVPPSTGTPGSPGSLVAVVTAPTPVRTVTVPPRPSPAVTVTVTRSPIPRPSPPRCLVTLNVANLVKAGVC